MFFSSLRERKAGERLAKEERRSWLPDPSWTNEAYVIVHSRAVRINPYGEELTIDLVGAQRPPEIAFDLHPGTTGEGRVVRPGVARLYRLPLPDGYEVALGNDGLNHLYDPAGAVCTVTSKDNLYYSSAFAVASPSGTFRTESPSDGIVVESWDEHSNHYGIVACKIMNDPDTGEAMVSTTVYKSPSYLRYLKRCEAQGKPPDLEGKDNGVVEVTRAKPRRPRLS